MLPYGKLIARRHFISNFVVLGWNLLQRRSSCHRKYMECWKRSV